MTFLVYILAHKQTFRQHIWAHICAQMSDKCSTNVSQMFRKCFTNVSQMFHKCFTNVLQMLHNCCTNVSQMRPHVFFASLNASTNVYICVLFMFFKCMNMRICMRPSTPSALETGPVEPLNLAKKSIKTRL